MTNLTGDPSSDFSTWLESTYQAVRAHIGDDAGAWHGAGEYENVAVSGGAEYGEQGDKGDVEFVVKIKDDTFRRGRSRRVSMEWRAYPNVSKVAERLLALYEQLKVG